MHEAAHGFVRCPVPPSLHRVLVDARLEERPTLRAHDAGLRIYSVALKPSELSVVNPGPVWVHIGIRPVVQETARELPVSMKRQRKGTKSPAKRHLRPFGCERGESMAFCNYRIDHGLPTQRKPSATI